jgi:hypothetical protein
VLAVSPPGEPWRIFNMSQFKPPNDPEKLEKGEISDMQSLAQDAEGIAKYPQACKFPILRKAMARREM